MVFLCRRHDVGIGCGRELVEAPDALRRNTAGDHDGDECGEIMKASTKTRIQASRPARAERQHDNDGLRQRLDR